MSAGGEGAAAPFRPGALPLLPRMLATFFGAGLSPVAPGTAGSLAALVPLVPLVLLPPDAWRWTLLAGSAVASLGCALISRRFPLKSAGGDPGWFVLDEAAGMWLAAAAAPRPDWRIVLIAFVLFRVFDAGKPPPLRWLERCGGGWGIVLDDLGAGVYALVLAAAAAHVFSMT